MPHRDPSCYLLFMHTTSTRRPALRTRRIRAGLYEVVGFAYTVQAAEDYDGKRSGWHLIHQGEWVQTFATKAAALEGLQEILDEAAAEKAAKAAAVVAANQALMAPEAVEARQAERQQRDNAAFALMTGRRRTATPTEEPTVTEPAPEDTDDFPAPGPMGACDAPTTYCEWFALCANEATTTEPHPVLGDVPICDRCKAKVDRLKGSIQDNRVDRVQGLRRSNAAGPHGTGRRPALDARQATEEQAGEAAHVATYEPDYGVRFVCSCGEVSGFYTTLPAAQEAHDEHVNPGPVTPGTTVLD